MKPFSEDVRRRIVQGYEETTLSYADVASRFQVSVNSVRRYVHQWREHGHVRPAVPRPRSTAKLGTTAEQWLVTMARTQVDASQDELRQEVKAHTGIEVSQPTICRLLHRAGLTRKKRRTARRNRIGQT